MIRFFRKAAFFSAALISLCASAKPAAPARANLRVPLDIPLLLSGNFGELRTNHFHSGVDFKTQGRTGLPVYCAADCYVSRIVVSPWGFGRAVYVTHPDLGLVTVYGHLESFSQFIDRPVRERQYKEESFRIDTEFEPGEIPVKRGQVIARSGNAGSSGGPHLHMDVRDAETEEALDPLAYYRNAVKDNVRPEVRALALYPREGVVDGSAKAAYRQGATLNNPFTAWGRVTPGIKAYDRMTGTSNIYGVKYLTLMCDGDTLYHRVIDHVDFARSRAVNTLVEFADVIDSGSWFMITEQPESRPLSDMVFAEGDGTLYIDSEREYRLEFILRDNHGNCSRMPFVIKGVKSEISPLAGDGDLAMHDRDFTVSLPDGASATLPAGTLYSDCIVNMGVGDAPAGYCSRRYTVGDKHVPLSGNYTLTVPIAREASVDKRRYTLVRLGGKTPSAVASTYKAGGLIQASVNRFGDYAVTIDSVAPEVKPVAPEKWTLRKKITYKISDKLSGIETYRGEIDGKWEMFELDGKTGTLSFALKPEHLSKSKKHRVKITVTDAAGNTTTAARSF